MPIMMTMSLAGISSSAQRSLSLWSISRGSALEPKMETGLSKSSSPSSRQSSPWSSTHSILHLAVAATSAVRSNSFLDDESISLFPSPEVGLSLFPRDHDDQNRDNHYQDDHYHVDHNHDLLGGWVPAAVWLLSDDQEQRGQDRHAHRIGQGNHHHHHKKQQGQGCFAQHFCQCDNEENEMWMLGESPVMKSDCLTRPLSCASDLARPVSEIDLDSLAWDPLTQNAELGC